MNLVLRHLQETSLWHKIAELVRPKPRVRPSEWAEQNVELDSKRSPARPGKWRNDFFPWTKDIQDVMHDNPGKKGVICKKRAQIGFTAAVLNVIAGLCLSAPQPMLFITGKADNAKHYANAHFAPMVKACEPLRKAFEQATKDGERKLLQEMPFTGGRIDFVGGGSPGDVSSRTYGIVFLDELEIVRDNFPDDAGDPVEFAEARQLTVRETSQLWIFSHPRKTGMGISDLWESRSDRRAWVFDCPHCAHPVRPRWSCVHVEGLKAAGPKSLELGSVDPTKVHFRCPACTEIITDAQRSRALWPSRLREGGSGRFESLMSPEEAAKREYVGLEINGLADPAVTVASLAMTLAGKTDELGRRTFFNLILGEEYDSASEAITVEHVRERMEARKGKILVPGGRLGCQFVAVGADAQYPESNPTYYCRAEAYDPRGVKFLTHCEKCAGDDAFIEWIRTLEVPFSHENGEGVGGKFGVSVATIDCGWNTGHVLDLCRRVVYSAVTGQRIILLPARYRPEVKSTMPAILPSEQKRIDPARPHLGAQKRWDLHRETWFGREMNRWHNGKIEIRCQLPPDFAAHITANTRQPGPDIHGWGNPDLIWVKRKDGRDDWAHAGALAEVGAVLEMNFDRLGEMLDVPAESGQAQEQRAGWADRFRTRSQWWG